MKYNQKAKKVAEQLVGRKIEANDLVAEIIETEAYEGGEQTSRRGCMKLAPGQLGVMPFRGLYFLNIGTEAAGVPSCVMIRAVKVEDELYDGPGKVGKVLDAKSLEYKVMEQDVPLSGRTKPSDYSLPEKRADNSLGIYRLK